MGEIKGIEGIDKSYLRNLDSSHLFLHEQGPAPICPKCHRSTWVELGGGSAETAYHPNIDAIERPGVDIVRDLRKGIPLHDNHADRIKGIHFIQHMGLFGTPRILEECHRVLKPGGSLYLLVGDMRWVFERILEEGFHVSFSECIWGEQTDDFQYHTWGFDFDSLSAMMKEAGFTNIAHRGHYNPWEFRIEGYKA